MKLSIVIVNYNVRHFLHQCLQSVATAMQGVDAEVFVVDNNSVDGSTQMVQEQFPWVKLISNKENLGFSRANNQAIRLSKGEFVLLLNPDTLVEEDTFKKVLHFMEQNPDAGGLGVKMVDGKGRFLPESKRGLPTPSAAFWKISGLSRIFPKSRLFGQYHLGYLDADSLSEVDVLSGAFMLLRRDALDKAGLLDEAFFMYGEDIDLSYRIQKAGYRNYYYPEVRIVHYKGESTKKGSLNYVRMFYQAMAIYSGKHYSGGKLRLFNLLINMAILLRASLAIMGRVMQQIALPLLDGLIIYGGILFIKDFWELNIKNRPEGYYPDEFLFIELPVFVLIWLASIYLSGAYDKPIKVVRVLKGVFYGTAIILIIYALLPEHLRFSRALILLGFAWALLALPLLRLALHGLRIRGFSIETDKNRRFAIVGYNDEISRVNSILIQSRGKPGYLAPVTPDEDGSGGDYVGGLHQLEEIVRIYNIDEVIFCSHDMGAGKIIDAMSRLQESNAELKIAPPASDALIGSNSIHTSGDIYLIDIHAISSRANRRSKRLFDISFSVLALIGFPIIAFMSANPGKAFLNLFNVLTGRKTWVGYSHSENSLPKIRQGILNPSMRKFSTGLDAETAGRLDMLYAKDYKVRNDISIVLRNLKALGK